ncbi:hypothetical protein Q5424_24520 [Conexibacter sp. JD483]|uniref:hypothetical protein n=1 Tax=unclassified Conexibacter TaxID=2627773 RepID=UPI00271EC91F|nr:MULTISPECIES: hypothetical protein [unclassified Conexibacter]MDO8186491.1 hypothetical protein [Conexibacter sp. CPCC 205706]MDO8200060.1 hypothetical protein [Conexibacter sp. CPCC 205762]MDR9372286.1 hypothetical protein [Conexibacter sp. JD483]
MGLQRSSDGSDPLRSERIAHVAGDEERRVTPSRVAEGTLACPDCDAPVALTAGPISPADRLNCPFCGRDGSAREFLSLARPTRPQRVVVKISLRSRASRA